MITPQLGEVDFSVNQYSRSYRGFMIEPLCFGGKFSPAGFWARRYGSWIKDMRIGEHNTIEGVKSAIDALDHQTQGVER